MKTNELELIPNTEAIAVLDESGLDTTSTHSISEAFGDLFRNAEEWREKAMAIVITDPAQVDEMKAARAARLDLKKLRVQVEKTRKALKEDSLRRGKAIDGVANVFKFLVSPIEAHLQEQEDFVARAEAKLKEERAAARCMELEPYAIAGNPPHGLDLSTIDEATWQTVLAGAKAQHADHIKAVEAEKARAKAEEVARQKRIAEEAAERKRLQAEAEKLRRELEAKAKQEAKIKAAAKAKQDALQAKARAEREAIEAKAKARREADAEKIRKEQAKARAAKAKADELLRKQSQAKAEQEEARRKAEQAPDKEKLQAYIHALLAVKIDGELATREGKSLANAITVQLSKLTEGATRKLETL